MLALPVVLTVVGLTLREGVGRMPDPSASAAVSDAWNAGYLKADVGAQYDVSDTAIDLHTGGVLAYVPGIGSVRANGWEATVWGGSVYASAERNGFTVAALDVPVVVKGELGVVVVQPKTQWRASDTALPDPLTDPVGWRDAIALDPLPEHFVRAQEETVAEWKSHERPSVVALSASVLGGGTTEAIARMALESNPSKSLAAAVRSRGELRFYSTVQPSVRDMAWAYVPENADVDAATWMGLMLLPLMPSAESSSLTARKWGETLGAAFDASTDVDLRSAVVPVLEQDILDIAHNGYPLRALQFAEATRNAVGSGATLSDAAAVALGRLSAMTPESLRASALSDIGRIPAATTVAPITIPEPIIIHPDLALEARAREMLAGKGAMFTGDSSIHTVGEGLVDVEGVVFGLASGDRSLRFRYAPDADTVQAVVGGEIQPYPVPWQGYIDWESAR